LLVAVDANVLMDEENQEPDVLDAIVIAHEGAARKWE